MSNHPVFLFFNGLRTMLLAPSVDDGVVCTALSLNLYIYITPTLIVILVVHFLIKGLFLFSLKNYRPYII